jgi:hypothetical protein
MLHNHYERREEESAITMTPIMYHDKKHENR